MVEFKTEILIFIQLIVIIVAVAFAAFSTLAGSIQTIYSLSIGGMVQAAVFKYPGAYTIEQTIEAAFILSLTLQSLGPPLVWGVAILGLYNPNWWFSGWAQWYAYFSIIVEFL